MIIWKIDHVNRGCCVLFAVLYTNPSWFNDISVMIIIYVVCDDMQLLVGGLES